MDLDRFDEVLARRIARGSMREIEIELAPLSRPAR